MARIGALVVFVVWLSGHTGLWGQTCADVAQLGER